MPFDRKKKSASDYKWEKETCMHVNLKIRYDSKIPEAIEQLRANGISANSYAIAALEKQLIADGYMPAKSDAE